ncbi:hypothetical protein R1sor_004162 [Riccia sorocarpa]|uniref:Aminoglycoside phosphotransferase domain-containing protein n=1 Tax=Riccia sorocarpa TaxID=122646 RepID=A0ABD3H707_9MARC
MVTEPSFSVVLFNLWVWMQTVILFGYSKSKAYLRSFFFPSEDPSNTEWIQSVLRNKFTHLPPIVDIHESSQALNGGGLVGLLYSVELAYGKRDSSAGYPRSIVVKQGKGHFQARLYARYSGSAREAIFYQTLVPKHGILLSCVPEIYYSRGDLRSGECIIVMEDLKDEVVPSGHLLGNQCWGEVPIPIELEMVSQDEVLRTIFMKMADIHVHFWRSRTLLMHDWLKGVSWRKGVGKLSWEVAMCNMRNRWSRLRDKSVFTPLLRDTIDGLLERTSWSRWQKLNDITSPDTPFTLVHGDFHANNILFRIENREPRTVFVDWSEVGIGCPFTELAQFMISNATIEFRRAHERDLWKVSWKIIHLQFQSVFTQFICIL